MSSTSETFVHACLQGSAMLEDVDDWVERWHEGEGDTLDLDTFLGFTTDEGALWAERPEALRFVIAAHRYGRSVTELMASRDEFALAARSKAPEDAAAVVDWLRSTRRLAHS